MTTVSGPVLFGRFAFPPNSLGYCGPDDPATMLATLTDESAPMEEVRHVVPAFQGAWPYLELIGHGTGHDPLTYQVVEAYWLGSPLLERIDLSMLGDSMEERFRSRAGWNWSEVVEGINRGGRPNHAFHVFCIYPWVGLLQSGIVEQPLAVLDRCRIRWGRVEGSVDDRLLVKSRPLVWEQARLRLGEEQVESVRPPADGEAVSPGDLVAMHWDYVCQRVTPRQVARLRHYHDLHLSIVNGAGRRLADRVER